MAASTFQLARGQVWRQRYHSCFLVNSSTQFLSITSVYSSRLYSSAVECWMDFSWDAQIHDVVKHTIHILLRMAVTFIASILYFHLYLFTKAIGLVQVINRRDGIRGLFWSLVVAGVQGLYKSPYMWRENRAMFLCLFNGHYVEEMRVQIFDDFGWRQYIVCYKYNVLNSSCITCIPRL